mgnify:CR=1 FL=1
MNGEKRRILSLFQLPNAAVCLQNSHLLNATIRENLTLGRDFSDESCLEALNDCCIAEEVMHMPDGLGTLAGENGIMLSGGQKQRILLARMLLTHPACICWTTPQAPWTRKQNERFWKPSGNGSGVTMGPQSSSVTVIM